MVQYFCDWCQKGGPVGEFRAISGPILIGSGGIGMTWQHICEECLTAFEEDFIPERKKAEAKEPDVKMVKSREGPTL